MRLALVLCLAALCGSAAAGRPDLFDASGDAGRGLLQTSTECTGIDHCSTCRFQFVRGTVTRAVCVTCASGYVPKALGAFCWCAAGYYWKTETSACEPCGANYYCPGSKSTPGSAAHSPCNSGTGTQTTFAKSDRECLAAPGNGWSTDGGHACGLGTYNPGYNNRRCSRCPGGLTTETTGKADPSACEAPEGFYYLRGKAVACAQGSYKTGFGNRDCLECNEGITTKAGDTAKTNVSDCIYLRAGYKVDIGYEAGVTNGTLCPQHTFRAGEQLIDPAAAINCEDCANGLKTPPEVTGATSIDECMAPPGYKFTMEGVVPKALVCGYSSYKGGYNREEACSSCPSGFQTESNTATSEDECFIPPGYGTTASGTAQLCPVNTYGRGEKTYGVVEAPCTPCIEGTNTDGKEGSISPNACVLTAGWGYYNGEARLCDVGYWNAGNNTNPCTQCAAGRTTLTTGKTALADCLVAPGYYGDETYVKPCPKGSYQGSPSTSATCSPCTGATTTSLSDAATSSADCDLCLPGYGPLASGSCTVCAANSFSGGFTAGACTLCSTVTKPTGYSDAKDILVSPTGSSSSAQCVREFSSGRLQEDNYLTWDYLSTEAGVLTPKDDANATMAACQDACQDDTKCIYFEYRSSSPHTCSLLLRSDATVFNAASPSADNWLLLEIGDDKYTANKMGSVNATNVGVDIDATYSTFALARAACKINAACAGISRVDDTHWRTFRGTQWPNTISKLRAMGASII